MDLKMDELPSHSHTGTTETLPSFPSSRLALWDRGQLPGTDAEYIHWKQFVPRLRIPRSIIQNVITYSRQWMRRHPTLDESKAFFVGSILQPHTKADPPEVCVHSLDVGVDIDGEISPTLANASDVCIPVFVREQHGSERLEPTEAEAWDALCRNSVALSSLYAGSMSISQTNGSEDPLLRFRCLLPRLSLRVIGIRPLCLFSSTLSRMLLTNMRSATLGKSQAGLLSMDASHRLILLSARDSIRTRVPILGFWVTNASAAGRWAFWLAALKFLQSPDIADRVLQNEKGFLGLEFSDGAASPQLYHCEALVDSSELAPTTPQWAVADLPEDERELNELSSDEPLRWQLTICSQPSQETLCVDKGVDGTLNGEISACPPSSESITTASASVRGQYDASTPLEELHAEVENFVRSEMDETRPIDNHLLSLLQRQDSLLLVQHQKILELTSELERYRALSSAVVRSCDGDHRPDDVVSDSQSESTAPAAGDSEQQELSQNSVDQSSSDPVSYDPGRYETSGFTAAATDDIEDPSREDTLSVPASLSEQDEERSSSTVPIEESDVTSPTTDSQPISIQSTGTALMSTLLDTPAPRIQFCDVLEHSLEHSVDGLSSRFEATDFSSNHHTDLAEGESATSNISDALNFSMDTKKYLESHGLLKDAPPGSADGPSASESVVRHSPSGVSSGFLHGIDKKDLSLLD